MPKTPLSTSAPRSVAFERLLKQRAEADRRTPQHPRTANVVADVAKAQEALAGVDGRLSRLRGRLDDFNGDVGPGVAVKVKLLLRLALLIINAILEILNALEAGASEDVGAQEDAESIPLDTPDPPQVA